MSKVSKRYISQLSNFNTYNMFKRRLLNLAENVFVFKNLPKYIDTRFMNSQLVKNGSVVFYYEEAVESLVALPYETFGKTDIYDRPITIQAVAKNGVRSKILNPDEYVIMYDNNGFYPIWLDLEMYAERLALLLRTMDINVNQQKTPRIFQVPQELKKTIEDLTSNIDAGVDTILTYDNLNVDAVNVLLSPAPLVVPELRQEFNALWGEVLSLIGITNVSIQKKERLIRDEMSALNGGTIASRYSRFEPRKKAVEEINEKFADFLNAPIEVEFYDKVPDSETADDSDETEDDVDEGLKLGGVENAI